MKLNRNELTQLCLTPAIIYFVASYIFNISDNIISWIVIIFVTNFLTFINAREIGRREEREKNKK